MVLFYCCCNYAIVSHIGIQFFSFVVLSVIIAPHNIYTPHISKTHLPIVSLNVYELKLNWCSKDLSRKTEGPPAWGVEAQLPPQSLKIYQTELPLFIEVCVFRMRFDINETFCQWCMSLNELKWVQMSPN